MDVRPVIIVAREDSVDAHMEALAARDLVASAADLGNVEAEIQHQQPVALVLVALPGDASARMIGHLRRKFGRQLPMIVAIGRRDLKLRDKCVAAGATDVSLEGTPDAVAALVDTAVHGWLRSVPQRPWESTLRVQLGSEPLLVHTTDIDPSGIGFADPGMLEPDDLVRLTLTLSDGELLLWAQVSHSHGEPGLRFVAMTVDERVRLVRLLRKGELPQSPGPVQPAEPVLESRLVWPPDEYDLDATELAARAFVDGTEVAWSPGVPSPESLQAVLSSLPPAEQRLFDHVPPTGFANPLLLRRAEVVRLHLQSLQREGEELLRAHAAVELNTRGLTNIFVHVDSLLAQLYKAIADAMNAGETEAMQQGQQFLKAVLADVDALRPITSRFGLELPDLSVYSSISALPPPLPEFAEVTARHDRMQRQAVAQSEPRRARRWAVWAAAAASVVVTIGVAAFLLAPKQQAPVMLGAEFLGSVSGVTGVVVTADEVQVRVVPGWHPSANDVEQVRRHVLAIGKRMVRVVDSEQRTLAAASPEALTVP